MPGVYLCVWYRHQEYIAPGIHQVTGIHNRTQMHSASAEDKATTDQRFDFRDMPKREVKSGNGPCGILTGQPAQSELIIPIADSGDP